MNRLALETTTAILTAVVAALIGLFALAALWKMVPPDPAHTVSRCGPQTTVTFKECP